MSIDSSICCEKKNENNTQKVENVVVYFEVSCEWQ